MEIQFFGANCVRLINKKASIVVDDKDSVATKSGDIALFTGRHDAPKQDTKIIIDQPGEYEVSDISIHGIAARAHIDEANTYNATMFKIVTDDVKIAVIGHIYPDLSDDQLEDIGMVDVLIIPVGGSGYTLDAVGALKVIKQIEPKIVIPTHYADKGITYEVPQASLEDVLKNLAMEPKETTQKLKIKPGELPEITQLIILERS